jgi:hypothetical protein
VAVAQESDDIAKDWVGLWTVVAGAGRSVWCSLVAVPVMLEEEDDDNDEEEEKDDVVGVKVEQWWCNRVDIHACSREG